ncbi:MAG: acylphosphatase [Deltaproteobacteria bacterium]|nr:acylphosphatase [Deltaproteobacteria bacterium]
MTQRLRIAISGRVQGVYFRASTRHQALRLGLSGWAKNLADGTVEVCAEGETEALNALFRWCQQGPASARVDRATPRWEAAQGDLDGFTVR